MRNNVRFSAEGFREEGTDLGPPELGRGGGRLASWVLRRLREEGISTAGPVLEDWGCRVNVDGPDTRFVIGCGPVDGSEGEWLVFVDPVVSTRARIFARSQPDSAALERICTLLDEALRAEPDIGGIEWFRVDAATGAELDHQSTPL